MRRPNLITTKGLIQKNTSYQAESLERKLSKITSTNEPIDASAPLIYTDRKDGVLPAYDVRTDRFDIAADVMDKVSKSKVAARMELIKGREDKKKDFEQSSSHTSDPDIKSV